MNSSNPTSTSVSNSNPSAAASGKSVGRFPLFRRLPKFEELSNDLVLDRFLDYLSEKNLELYPAQEEAILALIEGQNVILNTPTGSGKSLVAMALHFHSLAMGKRSIYTCPIKALVNEKFLQLCREFGPEQVGMITGDGSVNRDAPIICCTAEILANMALHEGDLAKVDDVIMDEFHYYSDRERGVAWQVPLLSLPQTRFLLMSATLGEMEFFEKELTRLNERETAVVSSAERPVPLTFEYRETPLHETLGELLQASLAPVYLVCFTQRETAEQAQNLMSIDFSTKEEKKLIQEALHGQDFSSPYGREIQKFLKHGVGIHHAGLLPKYRVLVEKLAQTGLLKVICGTDTLGVGVNIPIRTVLFTKLCKFDGLKTGILSVRDFHQIAGRAGRKGFDTEGRVVAQAPEHVIENKKLEAKAKADPKKAKKIVRAKPPERGFVHWDEQTFQRLISGKPEALVSRFDVSHGMLLNLLAREHEDGCVATRKLIRSSHEPESAKKKHFKHAWTLFRSLLDRGILALDAGKVKVNVDLQEDFSLNHALSLYLLDTINLLDPESETYALDLLTLVESILESPDVILRKQLDRVKTEKLRELKEAGMEYEERMEELEKLEHPKPLRDFIYSTFNEFSDKHPWVGTDNIRPKSIAREMFETFQSFAEYVKDYDLQRAEGILLRYLTDVYRACVQNVPEHAKNDDFDAVIEYFGSIVRQVDSSLLDEWERLKDPSRELGRSRPTSAAPHEMSPEEAKARAEAQAGEKRTRVWVKNEVFKFLRLLAIWDPEGASELAIAWAPENAEWSVSRITEALERYKSEEHKGILTDPSARKGHFTSVETKGEEWLWKQTIVDPDSHNDWVLVVKVKLGPNTEPPQIVLESLG